MKSRIYFTYYGKCSYDDGPKIYLDWFRHHKSNKYKGFTVTISVLGYTICTDMVSDGKIFKSLHRRTGG